MDALFDVVSGRHLNKWDDKAIEEEEEGVLDEDEAEEKSSSSGDEETKLNKVEPVKNIGTSLN